MKIMKRKYFFGWGNIKWLITELINIYSNKPSFFSKKRIESGIAFVVSQWGMIFFLINKYQGMSTTDFAIWAGMEFAVAGYILSQIQKEKKDNPIQPETDPVADVDKQPDPINPQDAVV